MIKTIGILLFFIWGWTIIAASAWVAFAAITPCAYEDSSNCYWDAQSMGNGQGRSFLDIAGITFHF